MLELLVLFNMGKNAMPIYSSSDLNNKNINSSMETIERKKCKNCLKRVSVDDFGKCPNCRCSDFFDD